MKRTILHLSFLTACLLIAAGASSCTKKESGTFVRPPEELYGYVLDTEGRPFAGAVVSDGYNHTETDANGYYRFDKRNGHAKSVAVSLPSDAKIKFVDGHPFYFYKLDKVRVQYDFTFERQTPESRFNLIFIGDPQVCDSNNGVARFGSETAPDIKEFASSYDVNSYAFALGDLVHNQWDLFDTMHDLFSEKNMGVALFPVIGNHDHEPASSTDYAATIRYQKTFGPVNYSFNRGKVHIAVIDDIIFNEKNKYTEDIADDVMDWLEDDLRYVDSDWSVFIADHAMISYGISVNGDRMYEILSRFKEARIISGHNHAVENHFFAVNGKEICNQVAGSANGVDWAGTICGDGAPMGYEVYEMNGSDISNQFYKPTKLDKSFQIRMYNSSAFAPFSRAISGTDYSFEWNRTPGAIIVSLWNNTPDWTINVYENGVLSEKGLVRDDKMYDLWSCTYFYLEALCATTSYCKRKNHLFYYVPDNPSAKITVKARDGYGNEFTQDQITTTTESAGKYL